MKFKEMLEAIKRKFMIRAAFAVTIVFMSCSFIFGGEERTPERPNIIIILIDALRRDHLGIYGYARDTTPNIDDFSHNAVVFQHAISQSSWTNPSVASLFSSLYPSTHGCVTYFSPDGKSIDAAFLDHKIITLAEALKEKGYATGGFVANHWICRRLQFDQGFDVFDPVNEQKPPASQVNEKALKWIAENRAKPFFVYLHYIDVHGAYVPPAPYDSLFKSSEVREMSVAEQSKLDYLYLEGAKNNLNYYIDQYDGCVRYVDHHIGEFLRALKEFDLFDNTIIIITSDHGEAFFEHGFFYHGHSVYNEEIDIPLIIKFPESIRFPDNKHHRVELIDVTATIFSLVQYHCPYPVDGWDLLKKSNRALARRAVFSQFITAKKQKSSKTAIIKDNLKAIYKMHEKKVVELYDLREDDEERNNTAGIEKDKAEKLETMIDSWIMQKDHKKRKLDLRKSTVTIEDKAKINQLRALGYIQ